MCLCIAKPKNKTLDRQLLARAFEQNEDGAGFAYAKKGKLTVQKGFFEFKAFWRAFNRIQRGVPAVVHLRKASSGAKNAENCHPFLIKDRKSTRLNSSHSQISYAGFCLKKKK